MEKFAPKITLPNGLTYEPKGWEWILGFAAKDCEWAMELAIRPSFRKRALEDRPKDAAQINALVGKVDYSAFGAETQ